MRQWVYHFAEHPSREALTSPEQTISDNDSWQLLLREHQQILSLPCSLYLVKLTRGLLPFNPSTGTLPIKDGTQESAQLAKPQAVTLALEDVPGNNWPQLHIFNNGHL